LDTREYDPSRSGKLENCATFTEAPLTSAVIERAVKLQQVKSMSLGDAIVAATALKNNCQLVAANIGDFSHINEQPVQAPF
jgi:toxin FitB